MNHINIQSLFLNYSNSKFVNSKSINNVDEIIYNNYKFWYDCSSYFN